MNWIEIISIALAPIVGAVSWFASKRKHAAETDSVVVKNSGEVIQQWKDLADRYERELSDIRARLNKVEGEFVKVESELQEERRLRANLQHEYDEFKKKVGEIK